MSEPEREGGGWRYLGETTDGGQVWFAPAGECPPDLDELAGQVHWRGGRAPSDRRERDGEMSERSDTPGNRRQRGADG